MPLQISYTFLDSDVRYFSFFIISAFSYCLPGAKWDEIADLCTHPRHARPDRASSLHPPHQHLRISILHQRKSEPFLPEVLYRRSDQIDSVIDYQEPVMCL